MYFVNYIYVHNGRETSLIKTNLNIDYIKQNQPVGVENFLYLGSSIKTMIYI